MFMTKAHEARFDRIEKSIDDLARATANGFAHIRENMVTKREFHEFRTHMLGFEKNTNAALYELDRKAHVTNERLDAVELRLDGVEGRLDGIEREIRSHHGRISVLEAARI